MARRFLTLAFIVGLPFLSGCCCHSCCGYRLFWRPYMFGPCGGGCGAPVDGCSGCSSCYGAAPAGGPMAPPLAPPPNAPVQPIPQLTAAPANAMTVPTRTLR